MGVHPLPNGAPPDPRPLSDSLDRVAASLGVPKATTLTSVFTAWESVVGESLAAHTRPQSLVEGVLVVAVEEPAWATQLRWLESDLLGRLGGVAGADAVRRIEVVVRPGSVGSRGGS